MKAEEDLYRSLLVEADFLLNAIYSYILFLRSGTDGRYYKNKVLTLFPCDNGSEKGTGVYENEHIWDPLL